MQEPTSSEREKLEAIAQVYHSEDLSGLNEKYHLAVRDALIPQLGAQSALEIGCGKGLYTQVLVERYPQIDVIDGSQELLNHISETHRNKATIRTHVALIEDFLETTEATWDHIYMTFLLEHLIDPVDVLQNIGRRLNKNGRLLLAVPNATSIHRQLAFRAGMIASVDELSANDHLVGHRRVYTSSLLREHIEKAGLRCERELFIGLKPLTLKQLEALPPAIHDALCTSADLAPEAAAYLAVECSV